MIDKKELEHEPQTQKTQILIAQDSKQKVEEFKQYVAMAEEKTVITLLEKLVDDKLLEFITEYPSTQYTKEMTKLKTYVISYCQVYNLDLEDQEDVQIINTMCREFMLKMTSHKRRRSHELVNGASRQDVGVNVLNENKGIKKFLGINR